MSWVAKVAGHIDRLGYIWCVDCMDVPEDNSPVYADSFPHCEDECENCGRALMVVAPGKVQIA